MIADEAWEKSHETKHTLRVYSIVTKVPGVLRIVGFGTKWRGITTDMGLVNSRRKDKPGNCRNQNGCLTLVT